MEEQKEFKANEVGSIVQLKSGSPIMTVTKIIDNDKVICTWFVEGENREAIFPILALGEAFVVSSITNYGKSGCRIKYL